MGLKTIFSSVALIDTAHQVSAVQINDVQQKVDLELVINSPSQAFAASDNVKLHLLPSIDDTNFEDGSATVDPAAGDEVFTFKTRTEQTAHRLIAPNIRIPSGRFKYALVANFSFSVTVTLRELKRDKTRRDAT